MWAASPNPPHRTIPHKILLLENRICSVSDLQNSCIRWRAKDGSRSTGTTPAAAQSQEVAASAESAGGFIARVRTIFQTRWCCLEMFGTLTGQDAKRAACLTVHQEFYARRSRLLLSLVKHVAEKYFENLPISLETLEKIKDQDKTGNHWAALKLSTYDLLAMLVALQGASSARKAVGEAIDAFVKRAENMCQGESPSIVQATVRVCTGELFSRIASEEKKYNVELGKAETLRPAHEDFNWNEDPIKIGLELRRQLYLSCHQIFLDTLVKHAEEMEEMDRSKPRSKSVSTVKVLGGAYVPLDEKITVAVEGPGLPELRKQMEKTRSIVKLFNGTVDPFEDVEEKVMPQAHCRVTQHNLKLPSPSKCWFSVDGSNAKIEHVPTGQTASSENNPETYLGIQINSLKTPNYKWAVLDPNELKGLILGVSEFICDDFQIRSKPSGMKCTRYPRDAPVRVCWTPGSSLIELVSDRETVSLELDSTKLDELRGLCDEIIRRIPGFVRLGPPQSPLIQESTSGDMWGKMLQLGAAAAVFVSLGLCLVKSRGAGFWKNFRPAGAPTPISTEQAKEHKPSKRK